MTKSFDWNGTVVMTDSHIYLLPRYILVSMQILLCLRDTLEKREWYHLGGCEALFITSLR